MTPDRRRAGSRPRRPGQGRSRLTLADQPRQAALEVLLAVLDDDAYANVMLPAVLRRRQLSGRDAAFATALTYGAIRWQGLWRAILAACVRRPLDDIEPGVLAVLILGTQQLLDMRVPAHAAVDSSCALARGFSTRRSGGSGPTAAGRAGFVNAVLRSVAERDVSAWIDHLDLADDLSLRWSHPAWVVAGLGEALRAQGTGEELPALLASDNEPALPTLAAVPGRLDPAELRAVEGLTAGRWSPWSAIMTHGTPEDSAYIASGAARVQDEGSQLVVLALLRAAVLGPDDSWLDMCSGPGGKAALLAGEARSVGASCLAVEQHEARASMVEDAVHGTGCQVLTADARLVPWGDRSFTRILVDAPCSGLGALRRRPDARWRRSPADVPALAARQRELLDVAIHAARSGGVICYATCSPLVAETSAIVRAAVAEADVDIIDAPSLLPEVPRCAVGPFVQLWPHRHGTDAMFLALLRKH